MTLDELRKTVGRPYQKLDENGKALGCMASVYALYPDIPRYDWPPADNFSGYFMDLLIKHGRRIPDTEIRPGDVVAFRLPFNFLHIGIYMGSDEIIHSITDETTEICRLSAISRRIEGVFRWDSCQGEHY
jgi:hypothetical protein